MCSSSENTDPLPVLTENEGANVSASLSTEADDGSGELSVLGTAGVPPQAVRTALSVSSTLTARGAAGGKLIPFSAFPAMDAGPLPAAQDGLGAYYVFLNPQTPQQLGQQARPDSRRWGLGRITVPCFHSPASPLCCELFFADAAFPVWQGVCRTVFRAFPAQ